MRLAAAEVPGEPARDVAEGQPARLRPLFWSEGSASKSQASFGAEKVGSSGRPVFVRTRPLPDAERGAELGGALILPAHHGRDRRPVSRSQSTKDSVWLAMPIPATAEPTSATTSEIDLQRPGKELAGIVLDQARRRAPGRRRPGRRPTLLQTPIVGDAASARAALVESEDHVTDTLPVYQGRDRAVARGAVERTLRRRECPPRSAPRPRRRRFRSSPTPRQTAPAARRRRAR